MARALVISVHLHDGRFHGLPEWPPSPARLFQALLAGAVDGVLSDGDRTAFEWLETLAAPTIGSPRAGVGQGFTTYVPNNDLDAVGRDPGRISEVRVAKLIRPRLFDTAAAFLYAWTLLGGEGDERQAQRVCATVERLYQFGRGVDMACARGEVIDNQKLDELLWNYPGIVFRPSDRGSFRSLACPTRGSLQSLCERYAAAARRFTLEGAGTAFRQLFSQPPKPRFVQVAYDSPPSRRVYELREVRAQAPFGRWPLTLASRLVELLRDAAAERLRGALPDRSAEIERYLVGRKTNGADQAPTGSRIRILPLPSIGHYHADRGIRRVLVEVPTSCPLSADDVHWAFSGLELSDHDGVDLILTPSAEQGMLAHYGIGGFGARVWRTVTPAALPEESKRRRIEPTRVRSEAKGGAELAVEQTRAVGAVVQALRHAEIRSRPEAIRVQREPFEARGERVEAFARGTRFVKERLWHVQIALDTPVSGPVVIGDGRFLGLGLMAPVQAQRGVHVFSIESGLAAASQATEIARAIRRAVLARVQNTLGLRTNLPSFFSGHNRDGSPERTDSHLTFQFDPRAERLLIVAPHVIERRPATRDEVSNLEVLDAALTGFRELRAGASGRLTLRASSMDAETDPLFAASRVWETVTPYQVTRHAKHVGAAEALAADIRAECRRRALPEPHVTPLGPRGVAGVGLVAGARLVFAVAVDGPIVLGRSRHLGGGLFARAVE